MIGRLITIEEIIDRVDPEDFFASLKTVLGQTCGAVLGRLAKKRCPQVWDKLPASVKRELTNRVIEECKRMFHPAVTDIKANIHEIFDIKQMAIDSLVGDKPLLVQMFQEIGNREFKFVIHVAGVMGFLLGLVQCAVYSKYPDRFWVLPLSGLFIGYFTNWLSINMIFKPVYPHILCCGYLNIQGVFLKRQSEVALDLTSMMCTHLVNARRMLEFVIKSPNYAQVLEIFQRNLNESVQSGMGRILPMFVGDVGGIQEDLMQEMLAELPNHSQEIEAYMDSRFALRETLGSRLAGLPPDQFEGMLHAVFQQDEWMVLLLGGILGIAVGSFQFCAFHYL